MSVKIKFKGFTLAELLIALAILGVIATFTIPKVLTAQQNGKKIAVLKETLSALSSITATGWSQGEINTTENGGYILRRLNVLKLCNTHADTQGCWTQAMPNPEEDEPGAIMHNGVTIGGLNDNNSTNNWVFVDWNGAEPPNVEGDDQLKLLLCYDPSGQCGVIGNKSGTIRPLIDFESEDLYQEVFSR